MQVSFLLTNLLFPSALFRYPPTSCIPHFVFHVRGFVWYTKWGIQDVGGYLNKALGNRRFVNRKETRNTGSSWNVRGFVWYFAISNSAPGLCDLVSEYCATCHITFVNNCKISHKASNMKNKVGYTRRGGVSEQGAGKQKIRYAPGLCDLVSEYCATCHITFVNSRSSVH
jgi:hypothetical protein